MKFAKHTVSIAIVLLLLVLSQKSFSQTLYFCEDIDQNGNPVKENNSFTLPEKGSPIKMLLRFNGKITTQYVSYDIYKVKADGHEIYQATIEQGVHDDWSWTWRGIYFSDEGTYKIYVYTSEDNLLASAQVKIDIAPQQIAK